MDELKKMQLICRLDELPSPEEIFKDRVLLYTGVYKIKINYNGIEFYHPQEFGIRHEAGLEVCKLRAKGFSAKIEDIKTFKKL